MCCGQALSCGIVWGLELTSTIVPSEQALPAWNLIRRARTPVAINIDDCLHVPAIVAAANPKVRPALMPQLLSISTRRQPHAREFFILISSNLVCDRTAHQTAYARSTACAVGLNRAAQCELPETSCLYHWAHHVGPSWRGPV